jgi:hypothetical protein
MITTVKMIQQFNCISVKLVILMCAIPLCVITKIIGTKIAVQHNFKIRSRCLLKYHILHDMFRHYFYAILRRVFSTFLYRSLQQCHIH